MALPDKYYVSVFNSPYIDLGPASSFGLDGDFTIEMHQNCFEWTNTLENPALGIGIAGTAEELSAGKSLVLGSSDYSSNVLVAQIAGGPVVQGMTRFSGKWVHVALRYTRSTQELALFLNGELEVSVLSSGYFSPSPSSRVVLGRSNLKAGTFRGAITEVRFFRVARTKQQIKADMFRRLTGKEDDLTSYFPLDGIPPDGTIVNRRMVVRDAKVMLDPITLTPSAETRPLGIAFGGSFETTFAYANCGPLVLRRTVTEGGSSTLVVVGEFDGTKSYISVPHDDRLTPRSFTVLAWVRPMGTGRPYYTYPIVSKHGPGQGWELRAGAGRGGFLITVDGVYHDLNVPLENDVWHLLAATYGGSTMRFYVNGVLRASKAVPSATSPWKITPYTGDMNIGRNPYWTGHCFAGQIGRVLFDDYAWDQHYLLGCTFGLRGPVDQSADAIYEMAGNANNFSLAYSTSFGGTPYHVCWVASDPPYAPSSATATTAITPDTYLDAVAQSMTLETQRAALQSQLDEEKRLHASTKSQAEKLAKDLGDREKEKQRLTDRISHLDSLVTDIEKLDGEIESLTNEINALKSPRGQISLADFVQKAHAEIQSARDALAATGTGYAFARMNLEVKMLPAPDGANLMFPELADVQAIGADKLSALTIRFESAETTTIPAPRVEVPAVVGTTEALARRTLAARRFVTETSYQAIPPSGTAITEADRVVTQLPAAGTSAPAGSKVTIFLGRET